MPFPKIRLAGIGRDHRVATRTINRGVINVCGVVKILMSHAGRGAVTARALGVDGLNLRLNINLVKLCALIRVMARLTGKCLRGSVAAGVRPT